MYCTLDMVHFILVTKNIISDWDEIPNFEVAFLSNISKCIMGILKFLDSRWRVKEMEFLKNLFISVILIYSDSEFHL